jgi:DNA mismatch repair protein MutL
MYSDSGRISVLPQSVTEKIAAGEVVERPASVVKELVENSLDAGASKIDITIEGAGFALIRITDNGCGMAQNDLERSVQRHATSKIHSAEDLFSIATFGFRGEALASVGAVSRLDVSSSASDDGLGYAIDCEGGECGSLRPVQHMRGTTISCRDLFFNVPARKKFMKSHKAERMALLRYIEQLVIPFPGVHFSITMEGKKALEAPQAESTLARIAQITGVEFAKELIVCTNEKDELGSTVYISPPSRASARPRYQYLYVNLRRVDSDSVTYGIRESFSRFITQTHRPAWFCFLDVDPRRLDVNVHPTKQRVKFDNEKAVFSLVYHSIEKKLPSFVSGDFSGNKSIPNPLGSVEFSGYGAKPLGHGVMEGLSSIGRKNQSGKESVQTALSFLSVNDNASNEDKEKELESSGESRVQLPYERWELIPCYQIHRTFILAPIKDGILLIDQHAAHERVLYEQALEDLKIGNSESQRLLFPILIEVSAAEKSVILSGREYLGALGFDIQDFGAQTIAISSIPAAGFLKESAVEEAIREMAEYLLEEKDPQIISKPQKRFAAAFACGTAIKAGQELKQEEMNSLLNSMFATETPFVCPHGRPTLVRMSLDELARRFLR